MNLSIRGGAESRTGGAGLRQRERGASAPRIPAHFSRNQIRAVAALNPSKKPAGPYGSFTISVLKIMLAGATASSRTYPSLRRKM